MKDPKELFQKVFIRSEADLPKEDGSYFIHDKDDFKDISWFKRNKSGIVSNWLANIDYYLMPYKDSQCHCGGYPDCICDASRKPIEQPAEKEQTITIPKWKMTAIEDVLRQANNIHHSQKKETCFDRCICKAWKFACDALGKEYSFESQSEGMENKIKLIEKLKRDLVFYMKGYKVESLFTEEEVNLIILSLEHIQNQQPKPQAEITDESILTYFANHYTTKMDSITPIMTRSAVLEMFRYFRSQMTANRREELIKFANDLWLRESLMIPHKEVEVLVDEYLTSLNQKEK